MSRLQQRFEELAQSGRAGLIPYFAAGHPSPDLVLPLLHALAGAGADVIELGVPFSDPMADGPTVQRASEAALAHGVTLHQVLGWVTAFRRQDSATPIVLMGYANPIERMGRAQFVAAAAEAGVDGVLVVDYPPEEADRFGAALKDAGIDPIFLVAPTTTEARMAALAPLASGYVYYVSLRGTTGAGHFDQSEVAARMPLLRRHLKLPIGVGFGIRDEDSARAVARNADAVVIGSKIIEELEQAPAGEAVAAVTRLVARLRRAIDDERSVTRESP